MRHKTFLSVLTIGLFLLQGAVLADQIFTPDKGIETALKNNPQIIMAKENLNASSARMGEASSLALPQLSVNGTIGKNYSQPVTIELPAIFGGGKISTTPDEAADISTYTFSVTQNLFAGGKILTGMAMAKVAYEVQQQNYVRTQQDVSFNVLAAYYEVIKSKKMEEVIDESLSNLNRNALQSKVFFDSGISPYTDLLRAQTSVANMEISKIQMKTAVEVSKLTLEKTIGQKLPASAVLDDNVLDSDTKITFSSDDALKTAYKNRPDWLAFKLGVKAAEDSINLAYAGYLPNIMYNYSVGRTKSNYPTSNTLYDLRNWRSVLVASWNLFDGFNTPNKVREAYALLNAAKAQETQIKDMVELEVRSVYLALAATVEKLAASKKASDLAERAFKATEVNYRSGVASEQYYLDAQTTSHNAKTALYTAKFELEVAKARLNKAVGCNIIGKNI